MVIIGAVMLLLFGNRLPSVMRSLGSSITQFKKGIKEIEEPLKEGEKAVKDAVREVNK